MKKNIISLKKFIVILILILLIFTSTANAFEGKISNFENNSDKNVKGVTSVVNNIGGTVLSIIRIVSVTIALVMLLVIAMKYMLASPGDRADIKKHAVAYIVGAFILFGVTGIISILTDFASQITPG